MSLGTRCNFNFVLPVRVRGGVSFLARCQGVPKPPHAWRYAGKNIMRTISVLTTKKRKRVLVYVLKEICPGLVLTPGIRTGMINEKRVAITHTRSGLMLFDMCAEQQIYLLERTAAFINRHRKCWDAPKWSEIQANKKLCRGVSRLERILHKYEMSQKSRMGHN